MHTNFALSRTREMVDVGPRDRDAQTVARTETVGERQEIELHFHHLIGLQRRRVCAQKGARNADGLAVYPLRDRPMSGREVTRGATARTAG
jgi:hypothetical protein